MAINESSRLVDSLRKEEVPVNRLIVNQVMSSKPTDCKFCNMKRKVSQLSVMCYSWSLFFYFIFFYYGFNLARCDCCRINNGH